MQQTLYIILFFSNFWSWQYTQYIVPRTGISFVNSCCVLGYSFHHKFTASSVKLISSITDSNLARVSSFQSWQYPHGDRLQTLFLANLTPCNENFGVRGIFPQYLSQEVTKLADIFTRKRGALEWEMAMMKVTEEGSPGQGTNASATSLNNWTVGVSLGVTLMRVLLFMLGGSST